MSKKILTSLEEFLLNTPLYEESTVEEDQILKYLYGIGSCPPFDGFCPFCEKETTYKRRNTSSLGKHWEKIKEHIGFGNICIACSRCDDHVVHFHFYLSNMTIQKIGQYPSLADIANIENNKKYRNEMSKEDGMEFYKAIGLAAHGVGVGSFVYLRRIFERLINTRFQDHKDQNSWDERDFNKKRMDEKIIFMKDYLPEFIAKNAKIYSILSRGIHELKETQCLNIFAVLKDSIIYILEEDKKKKEELELRKRLESSIANFQAEQD